MSLDIERTARWRQSTQKSIAVEDYKINSTEGLERLKYQVEFSQAALRNLHLVNGGAIIALLTFVGNVSDGIDKLSIFWSFVWFSSGLACSLLAYLGAYFSQAFFMNVAFSQAWEAQHAAEGSSVKFPFEQDLRRGNVALLFGIGMELVSMACFIIGAFVAIEGLK